jgi:uncharacterized protein (DUF58 family)
MSSCGTSSRACPSPSKTEMPFRDAWIYVGGLLVILGFAAAQPAIGGVGFVILVIGAVTRYWSRHLFDRVRLTRRLGERRAFIGERVGLEVELENRKPLPLPWYEWQLTFADALRIDGEMLAGQAVPGTSALYRRGAMGWYERRSWHFEVSAQTRGHHQVGPARIKSSDLLGVFQRVRDDDDVQYVTVFPRVFTLRELGLPADRPFGEQRGRDRIFEDPLRIKGLREYRPGDPLRRIDWKATARRGDLQSRVYEPSAVRQLYVLLNIDTLEHAWEGYLPIELERTISVAASIAVWGAGARYAVGLLANGSFPNADRPIRLAPSRSPGQLTRLLEALAVIQPLTMGDLAGAVQRESGRMPLGSTIVLVASIVPAPLAGIVRRLADEGHRVAVIATSDRVDPRLLEGLEVMSVVSAFEGLEVTA